MLALAKTINFSVWHLFSEVETHCSTVTMKATATILSILFIQTFTTMASAKTERQKYRVVHTEKEYEIRFYPSATLATVYTTAKSYRELSGTGFRRLAGYIFGGNESGQKIAMTAPVHMDIQDKGSAMSFVMPSAYEMENLPAPNDGGVVLEKTKDEYVAVLRFRGYASDKDIKRYSAKLATSLEGKGIKYMGNFRYLGYNPPYQFIGRRNEIIVKVDWPQAVED
jgi:hypothetical protein